MKKKSLVGWTYGKCVPVWCGNNRFCQYVTFQNIFKVKGNHSKHKVRITIEEIK
jgi:hypothetical protein